jgi:hypothetical protein
VVPTLGPAEHLCRSLDTMPIVCLDTNMIDPFVDLPAKYPDLLAHIEAVQPPPSYLCTDDAGVYWIMTLAPVWSSVLFTFSPRLYEELQAMPPIKRARASALLGFAVELRENNPEEYINVEACPRPSVTHVQAWGLGHADALHIVDAIGMGASYFLTFDKQLRRKAMEPASAWRLRVSHPMGFIRHAYSHGAPFPANVELEDLRTA